MSVLLQQQKGSQLYVKRPLRLDLLMRLQSAIEAQVSDLELSHGQHDPPPPLQHCASISSSVLASSSASTSSPSSPRSTSITSQSSAFVQRMQRLHEAATAVEVQQMADQMFDDFGSDLDAVSFLDHPLDVLIGM
jgi:hypothetical protein